ncbi:MAG: hypothetical protein QG594_2116 [Bacteroidota bacterium]|nr:hypothetical protein [Bacteroidota bacterium]
MKKSAFFVLLLLITNNLIAQKMITRNGKVIFEASTPSFEEIKGTNSVVSSILNPANNEFVALILIKSFKFKSPLMEEHFNENYLESNTYPKATFKGKVLNLDVSKLTATKTNYDLEGDLTIHGVTKKIKTKINLSLNGTKILATSAFSVKPQDFKIEIPSLVKAKIADEVKISVNLVLEAN